MLKNRGEGHEIEVFEPMNHLASSQVALVAV